MPLDFNQVPTPCYVVDQDLLVKNLELLDYVQKAADCRILLALKGFSMYAVMPLIGSYLQGITASSLHEARLGYEEMGKQVHIYSPAFIEEEFPEILSISDHIVFNTFDQWNRFRPYVEQVRDRHISCGLRINPEYSEIETPLYDPCYTHSRLGTTLANFREDELEGLEGLHFHAMCEQNSDTLARIVDVVSEKFGKYISKMKWVNFGGGHHITRADYDVESLINTIRKFKQKYNVEVYLEPGEAIALNTGFLVARVLDTLDNGMRLAILDTSAACHMPDVLEMPYRPQIIGAGEPGEYEYTYRLGGLTCLAGDVIGDYSFKQPLRPGDRLVFCDMAHYTMVKNNTFNGVRLPSIALYSETTGLRVLHNFGYEDFRSRLS
jgi:carboxynorspermidine decarboxylase